MKPKDADKAIKAGRPITVRSKTDGEFTIIIVRRNRWNVYTSTGAVLDRGELTIVK